MVKNVPFIRLLVLEPYIFVCMFSDLIRIAAIQALIQDKVCLKRNHSPEVCSSLHNKAHKDEFNELQSETNNYYLCEKVILTAPCIVFMFFVGSWIDKYSNAVRNILLVTSAACCLESVFLVFNSTYFEWPVWVLVFGFLAPAFSGGLQIRIMAVMTQATRETKQKLVAIRIALIQFSLVMGQSCGGIFVSYFLKTTPIGNQKQLKNYTGIFLTCLLCNLLALVWTWLMVGGKKSSNVEDSEKDSKAEVSKSLTKSESETPSEESKTCCDAFFSLWDFNNVTEAFKVSMKKRDNNGRLLVWLLIISSGLVVTATRGPMSILYPYTQKALGWEVRRFAFVVGVGTFISMPLTLVTIAILVKKFKIQDAMLGIIGSSFVLVFSTIRGLIQTEFAYYISHGVVFGQMATVAIRSLIKPLVNGNEMGRLFTFLHVSEAFVDFAMAPVITIVFNATFAILPGFIFILLGAFIIFPLLVFIYMWFLTNGAKSDKVPEAGEETEVEERKVKISDV